MDPEKTKSRISYIAVRPSSQSEQRSAARRVYTPEKPKLDYSQPPKKCIHRIIHLVRQSLPLLQRYFFRLCSNSFQSTLNKSEAYVVRR